jgi:RimJ/RimL family protein N-acetyltransferase
MALLSYAFDSLGAEKVTLKCDGRNARSARAIQKLGAKPEGVLRHHRFTQYGEFRDTAYFGILREEWPVVKKGLLERLDALKS